MKRKLLRGVLAVCVLGMLQAGCGQKAETEAPSGKETEEEAGKNEETERQYDALLARGGEISGQSYISEFGFTLEFPEDWEVLDREETVSSLEYASAEEELAAEGRFVDAAFIKDNDAVLISYEILDESLRGTDDIASDLAASMVHELPEEDFRVSEAEFAGAPQRYVKETDTSGTSTYWIPFAEGEALMLVSLKAESGDQAFEEFLGYAYDTEKGKKRETTAYEAYKTAVSLTREDLEGGTYEDLLLLTEDMDWVNSSANKEGTVKDGALYRKLGALIWGNSSERGHNESWTIVSEYVLGYAADSYSEYLPYAQNAAGYFLYGDFTLDDVVSPLLELESVRVTGTPDPSRYAYHFEIPDLKACAREMQVTEKALGYLLAQLNESGADIEISENAFSFHSEGYDREGSSGSGTAASGSDYFDEVPELLRPDALEVYQYDLGPVDMNGLTGYKFTFTGDGSVINNYLFYVMVKDGVTYSEETADGSTLYYLSGNGKPLAIIGSVDNGKALVVLMQGQ